MHATCPAHLSRLDLIYLIMVGEEYNAYSSELCNFLHSPVISSLLDPNIFLSTSLSNTFNLCSSLNVRDQVSQPYNETATTLTVKYINRNLKLRLLRWAGHVACMEESRNA